MISGQKNRTIFEKYRKRITSGGINKLTQRI